MKQISSIFMLILLLSISSCNKQKPSNNNTQSQKKEIIVPLTEEQIRTAVEDLNQAIIHPNATVLEALCSSELTYGHSSGLVQNKSEFINDLLHGPYNFTSVTSPDLTISISGNTAIARFIFLATATKADQQIDIRIGCVQIFQRENNKLKLLARQAFKLPKPAAH